MATTITTGLAQPLDAICRQHYGDESGYVETVLDANPGLAALGPVIPRGTTIILPTVEVGTGADEIVTLW